MGYTLVYTQVLEFLPYLIKGAWISLQIAILAFFGGMFFGLILATIRTFGNKISNNNTLPDANNTESELENSNVNNDNSDNNKSP